MEKKLEQIQERSREEIERTIQNYRKQISDLEQAKAKAQTVIESQKETMHQQAAAKKQLEINLQHENRKMQNKMKDKLEAQVAKLRKYI